MNKKVAIATVKVKLKKKTNNSSFESIVALMNLYIEEHPEDKYGYNILTNYLRRCELAIETTDDLIAINKHFS